MSQFNCPLTCLLCGENGAFDKFAISGQHSRCQKCNAIIIHHVQICTPDQIGFHAIQNHMCRSCTQGFSPIKEKTETLEPFVKENPEKPLVIIEEKEKVVTIKDYFITIDKEFWQWMLEKKELKINGLRLCAKKDFNVSQVNYGGKQLNLKKRKTYLGENDCAILISELEDVAKILRAAKREFLGLKEPIKIVI